MSWSARQVERPRLITLTNAPEEWQPRRKKIRRLAQQLRERGYDVEWGWATEKGQQTGMTHVHAVAHGDYIPQRVLQDEWGAIVDIRAIAQAKPGGAVKYVTKEALRVVGYTLKGATAAAKAGGVPDIPHTCGREAETAPGYRLTNGYHSSVARVGGPSLPDVAEAEARCESPECALPQHLALNGQRVAHWSRGFLHGYTKREALAALRAELASGEAQTWRLVPAWR